MKFPKKKINNVKNFYQEYTNILTDVLQSLNLKNLSKFSNELEKKILTNKNIFVCGNGGSAAIANHLVCDYIKLLRKNTKLKPRVISLSTSIELITAISNDFSYDKIFSEQLSYLANKGDLLILISSSGNSKNIINALRFCKKNKIKTVGLSGFKGGYLSKNADISLHYNCENYGIS
ncbi:SIS domain-containing protein, partial [Candidatus Pelagibacter sp.]|nr:SIS domain-containing protein [Candidatus Pelagibacter sp.]